MKKLAFYMSLIVTGLLMAACNEDFKDWAAQKTYLPEDAITIPGYTVSAASETGIDLNAIEGDDVQLINLSGEALPQDYLLNSVRAYFTPADDATAEPVILNATDNSGVFSKDELQEVVVKFYGVRPTPRTLKVHVYADAVKDGQGTLIDAGETTVILTPIAPFIDPAGYYVVGNIDGWSCTRVDNYHMVNNGGDVYENPVFSVLLTAVEGIETYEVKILPASAFNEDGSIANWGIALSALPGHDEVAYKGSVSYNNAGGNIKFAAAEGAKFYSIKVNMLEGTYEVTSLSFQEYIYEAGVNNGWGGDFQQPLYCADGNGTYTGFFYAKEDSWTGGKGAFKFRGAASNWDNGNYGTGTFDESTLTGTLVNDGGSGNIMPEPGFYRADVNLGDMTFKLIPINSVYVVGSAVGNDWDTGVAMTYNHTKHCWECDATFTEAGVIKFKGNGTWDSIDGNWGGTMDNIINGSNDNIPVTLSGDVHIEFYPLCDTKSYCTITAR